MKENSNKQWGGKRINSGRKKKEHGKYFGFNSTLEVENILNSISSSKTEFINEAIIHYSKFKNLI